MKHEPFTTCRSCKRPSMAVDDNGHCRACTATIRAKTVCQACSGTFSDEREYHKHLAHCRPR